jgi:hypothetical protein
MEMLIWSVFVYDKSRFEASQKLNLNFFFDLFTSFSRTTSSEWPKNKNKFSTIVIQNRTRKYKELRILVVVGANEKPSSRSL